MIDANIFRAYAPQVFTATQRLEAEAAKRMREAEMAQRNRLMELQISAAQDTARETAMQRAERVAAQERMKNALAMLPSPEMRASQNALAGGGGPTVANAAGMRPVDPRASMLYQLAQADQSYIPKYLETLDPNFGREEVSQFIETQGGRVGVNRFGDTTGKPIPFAPDVQMVNLGGRTVAVDRRAVAPGTAFDVTMTPSERDASSRGWASVNLQRQAQQQQAAQAAARLEFDRQTASSKTPEQKPLTEGQAKAVLFGNRAKQADEVIRQMEAKGVTSPGKIKRTAESVGQIVGLGTSFGDVLASNLGSLTNITQSAEQQAVEQAQRDFINAVLRRESGAVIADSEFDNARKQYFPVLNDDAKTIELKRRARQTAINGILAEAPEGRRDIPGAAPSRNITVDW